MLIKQNGEKVHAAFKKTCLADPALSFTIIRIREKDPQCRVEQLKHGF